MIVLYGWLLNGNEWGIGPYMARTGVTRWQYRELRKSGGVDHTKTFTTEAQAKAYARKRGAQIEA